MVEVDPVVLIAGTAAIAVLGVVACVRGNGERKERGKEREREVKAEEKTSSSSSSSSVETTQKKQKKEKVIEQSSNTSTTSSLSSASVPSLSLSPAPASSSAPQTQKQSKSKTSSASVPVTPAAPVKQAPSPALSAAPSASPIPSPAPVSTSASEPISSESNEKKKKAKETPEQKAARLERLKKRKEEAALAQAELAEVEYVPPAPVNDGWAVVEDKRKQKPKKSTTTAAASETASSSDAPAAPAAPEHLTSKITVDPKKIGIIIGPKGATLRAIQELTEATINMPKADRDSTATASISIVGSAEAVQNASNIIIELCTKGYSTRLEGENFQESHISVHNQFLSEIIGKNGSSVRALQDKLGIRISIPANAGKDDANVKIGIAGDRENITQAKDVIREIMTYYHSPITHPGWVHVSLDIPSRMYNSIIGARGGEIRHIQNNFKVSVHIPNANSLTQHLIIVGDNLTNVENASRYVQKIVQQITNDEAANATVVDTWNEQNDRAASTEDEPEWVSQYVYNREASKQVNLMAAVNVPISLSNAEANAWKIADSAEGW